MTRVGKVIRKLSLDEMPQFINVAQNKISIVGPRPSLPRETALYTNRQKQRLLVKPGITCYWQTRLDRDKITFDEWVDLDLCRNPT
ncbi:MAG: sugar transferase [Gordonibacter sp.]|uniref:sugar transferase n=1 Tax=Gordonibacter sp. TaxID=1968902 RepID=UPI002FCAFB9E